MKLRLVACGIVLGGFAFYGCSSDSDNAAPGAGGDPGAAGAGEGGESSPRSSGGNQAMAGRAGASGSGNGVAGETSSAGAGGAAGEADSGDAGAGMVEPLGGAGGVGNESPNGGAGGAETCNLGEVASAGTQQDLNLFGEIVYYADGATLPAGRYRATYVDGCMKYGGGQDWTIHAYADANPYGWWFVGDTTADKIVAPPGIVGYAASNGAYASFEDCVTANKALPPLEFDFAGGKIGVWLQDSPYTDNLAGQDGRNPKWQLTLLGECQ